MADQKQTHADAAPDELAGERTGADGRAGRIFPAFAIFASLGYFVCMGFNFAPFAYYPFVGEFHSDPQPETLGPPMFWYGWIIYGALIGAAGSVLMLVLPGGVARALAGRLSWLVWAVPTAIVFAVAYLLRGMLF